MSSWDIDGAETSGVAFCISPPYDNEFPNTRWSEYIYFKDWGK